MAAQALKREVPLPLYFRLREVLLEEIRERGLRPGDRLPTEADLERRYGVSRSTIRRAMSDLAAEGLVRRVQGKGTFVDVPKIQHTPVLTSFSELLRSQGYTPAHRLLATAVVPAPPAAARSLEIAEAAPCRYLHRLFLADGDPVGVSETWLPRTILGSHDHLLESGAIEDGSLYELLQREPIGLVLHNAVETISPGLAGDADAELLRCEPGAALLLIHRITRTPEHEPVEWTRLLFVGGRYEYRVQLHRPPGAGR